jgi:hypothetical protein
MSIDLVLYGAAFKEVLANLHNLSVTFGWAGGRHEE